MSKTVASQKISGTNKSAEVSQSLPQINGQVVIRVGNIGIPFGSTNPNDYVEVLNKVANKVGSFDFLGTFSDVESVECSNALKVETSSSFVHVEVKNFEQPDGLLNNDGSSTNPFDYPIKQLLNM